MKQNFPLKYFLGDNVNVIEIQIWVTMIAYLLLRVMQTKAKSKQAFSNIVMLTRVTWHFPLHNDNISGASEKAEKELKKQYPSLYNWLKSHKDSLSERNQDETGIRYEWYTLQRCAASYYQEFDYKEKNIWGLTADKWAFTIDTSQHYLSNNGYILTSTKLPIKYILGLLNSKLMHYYFHFIGIMTVGGAYTLKAATISALPFKVAKNTDEIAKVVDEILLIKSENHDADVLDLEKAIDSKVFSLYGLSEDDIKIVDEWKMKE